MDKLERVKFECCVAFQRVRCRYWDTLEETEERKIPIVLVIDSYISIMAAISCIRPLAAQIYLF